MIRGRNISGVIPGGTVESSLRDDLDAYDALPPALRKLIREAPYKVAAVEVADMLESGSSVPAIARAFVATMVQTMRAGYADAVRATSEPRPRQAPQAQKRVPPRRRAIEARRARLAARRVALGLPH